MGTTKYLDWSLSYNTYGENVAEALVFIHGASSDQRIWKYLIDEIEDSHYLITFDLLGHGQSEKPVTDYTTKKWADNLKQLVDHLSLSKVTLVAHSFGVLIAKHFLHQHPGLVTSFVIVDGSLKQILSKAIYDWMKTTMDRPDYQQYMKSLNENKTAFCLKKNDSDLVTEGVFNTPKYVLMGQLEAMTADTDLEMDIRVPVLAFYAKSHEWNEESEQYLRSHAKDLELHIWEDVSHFLMLDKPRQMGKLIADFVSRKNK